MVQAYCVRCKAKKEMKDPQEVTLANGKHAIKGKCIECDCNMMTFVKGK